MAEQAHAPSTGRQAMAGRAVGNTATGAAGVKRGESDYAAALGRPEVEAKLLAAVWQRKPGV
ncbi:MAG: hypothetical protein J2O49_03115, partial [Sciscionella sp.]|nr:hypothetical protein [Sciscionella sp.]